MADNQNQYNHTYYNQAPYQEEQPPMYNPPQYQPQAGMDPPLGYVQKSRVAAGILAMLLGAYGIHSFYLGNTSRGLVQLLVSFLTCGFGAIAMQRRRHQALRRPHQYRRQRRILKRLNRKGEPLCLTLRRTP